MGMLFNTDATIQIVQLANTIFKKSSLHHIRNSILKHTLLANIASLSPAAPNGLYASVAQPLQIDFGAAALSGRWQTFLRFLDRQPDAKQPAFTMAIVLAGAIAKVLHDTSYQALEFFAVPVTDNDSYISVQDFITAGDQEKTLTVTIYTVDVDSALRFLLDDDPDIGANSP